MRTSLKRTFYPLPDAMLGLYALCIARQYLWLLGGSFAKNVVAWSAAAMFAVLLIWLWSAKRGNGWEGTESTLDADWHAWRDTGNHAQDHSRRRIHWDWPWLLLVVVPLLVFFFLRAPFPSVDFDNLNYHLVNTQRALRGWPMVDGDFFPGTLLVNPAPDMLFGVARIVLGYRLAPIVNVVAVLWLAHLLNEIFATFIKGKITRYLAVLFAVGADHVLYLLNLYMIDLFSLPLLLGALLMTLRFAGAANKANALMKIALWLGIAVAFKFTNICVVLPILFLLLFELWKLYGTEQFPHAKHLAFAMIIVAVPSALFFGYMYYQTGNPLFPYLNNIFHSDLMTPTAYRDLSHGPENLWQKILWPVVSFIHPEKLSAMAPVFYTGRINIGFVLACALLVGRSASAALKKISAVFILSSLLWSFASGDVRYILLNEVLGGVLCVYVLAHVLRLLKSATMPRERLKVRVALALYGSMLVWFFSMSIWFGLTHVECFSTDRFCGRVMQPYFMTAYAKLTYKMYDNAFRPYLDTTPSPNYFKEAGFFLRDRNAQDFMSAELLTKFSKVDVWINCYDATSGVMTMAAPNRPMISVAKFLDLFDYMKAEGAQRRVRAAIESQRGKRMYTLVLTERLEQARTDLARAPLGLHFGSSEAVNIPVYSPFMRTDMMLVEVLPDSIANQ
jgi:hypothetical protein